LQDPTAPEIFEPYRRLPQLNLDVKRNGLIGNGMDFGVTSEFVAFDRRLDEGVQRGVQGQRLHVNPRLSYSVQTPYATVTPKLGWLFTRYDLDGSTTGWRDATNVNPPGGSFEGATRSMPVFSVDTGVVLERDDKYFGRGFIQTLEPRLYYLNIPYRKQDTIPVFDSVIGDLSMDRLFSENQYVGVDRINDANQLTFAVTSRFLEKDNGKERMSITLGQRYYLSDQKVTFPGQAPRSVNSTDLLALASGQLTDKLRISSGLQLNAEDNELVRANLGLNWRDGPGRVFNADYRYINKDFAAGAGLNQLDLSAQWPLAPKWYGMARLNYSLEDSRLVEGLVGAEYNAGCWSLRGVMQRLATAQNAESNAFFLQLELRGLTKLGPNPLDILTRSISGYAKSDEFDQ
jgi:LPS-assembly protein